MNKVLAILTIILLSVNIFVIVTKDKETESLQIDVPSTLNTNVVGMLMANNKETYEHYQILLKDRVSDSVYSTYLSATPPKEYKRNYEKHYVTTGKETNQEKVRYKNLIGYSVNGESREMIVFVEVIDNIITSITVY